MSRLKFYKRLSLVSGLVLVLLNHFAFGFLAFLVPFAKADTITWVGSSNGYWEEPMNWSGGEIPTALDNVVIDLETNGPVYATSTINFASLTLENMNKDNGGAFALLGNIGTGGDIILRGLGEEPGNFSFTSSQTISGTLTVEEGAALFPVYLSTSTPITPISFSAENIDIQSGGYVVVVSASYGFQGGSASSTGEGPGAGIFGTGPNGSGGAHAGNGGKDAQGDLGGEGYCNFEDPTSLGSSGAGSGSELSNNMAHAGFHLKLEATNEMIVNGTIQGDGWDGDGSAGGSTDAGGGGAGGSVVLSADIISGTPQIFDVSGGDSVGSYAEATSGEGGGGGGGCVKISYGTSNSITSDEILAHGGYGYQRGGAGTVFIQKQDDAVRQLFLSNIGNSSSTISLAAETPQTENELSLQTLSLTTSSIYTIGLGKTLTLTSSSPFAGSSPSGTLKIEDGGTLRIDSDALIRDVTIELHEGGSIVDIDTDLSNTLNFTIWQGATFDMRGFTTSTPFIVKNFLVDGGGVVTHGSHEGLGGVLTHMVNIQAEEIVISNASSINVSGKGFAGGVDGEDGNGPGGGEFVDMFTAVGAGHGGAGNASDTEGDPAGAGGSAYCDVSNPSTLGSGGASGFHYEGSSVDGGNGGGLVWLVASSSIVLEGDILADGTDGDYAHFISEFVEFLSNAGAGAGGGVKMYAPQITGSGEIFVRGGNNGVDPSPEPSEYGGGGGGCVLVNYVYNTNQVVTSSVYLAGGGLDAGVAEDGLVRIEKENEVPEIFLNFHEPRLLGEVVSTTALDQAIGLDVSEEFAYVASFGDSSLRVIDISSSTNPVMVGGIKDDADLAGAGGVAVVGDYALVTAFTDNSLRVIDISSSTNPVMVGGIKDDADLAGVTSIAVSGDYAYVVGLSNDFFRVIDISDLENPVIVGDIVDSTNLNGVRNVTVSGGYAYVASQQNSSVQIIDISDPENPEIVGGVRDTLLLDMVSDVAVSGNYAYATGPDQDALIVIDISDPENPEIVATVRGATRGGQPPIDSPQSVTIVGEYAYVSFGGGNRGVAIFDISDPVETFLIGYYATNTAMGSPYGLSVVENMAYMISYDGDGLHIFDISPPIALNPSVKFHLYDGDRQDVSVKAEYRLGVCSSYTGVSYPTFSTTTPTSTYGVSIDNDAIDNRRITDIVFSTTSDFAFTMVSSTWLASLDEPEQEGDYCMFMTPYDGVVEGVRVASTLIIDDVLVAPNTPVLSVANKNQTSITLTWAVVGGTEFYTVSSSISGIPTETTETSITYAGLSSDTEYVFQIKATDNFGNGSAYSNTFTVETERPPTGGGGASLPPPPPDTTPSSTPTSTVSNPSGLIVINNGAYYTKSREVTVSFNTEFTSAYILADTLDFSDRIYTPITSSTTYTLTPGDGEKRIYARFSNNYGIYDAYDVIVLDTLPPLQPTINAISSPDLVLKTDGVYGRKNASSTVRIKPTLGGTAEPGKRIVITATYGGTNIVMMVLAAVETYYTTADSNGNWSFTFPNELQNTYYSVSVQVQDEAGNTSGAVETEFDLRTVGASPCTINCEPPEELPPEEPPEELPPIEEPPEELPPIETPEEIPSCTTDCGGEETPPVDTGGDGMGTDGETTTDSTSTGDTEGNIESSSSESVSEQVVSSITDSVSIISDTIETFFTEVSNSLQEIPIVRGIVETVSVAVEKTREVIDNPTVEKNNEVIAAPIIAAAAVANVAVGGAGLFSQVMLYLRLIFSQPLLLLKLRKRKSWGVVFNAYTKLPLDLVTVRLVNGKSDSIMRTQVTDTKGRYFMVAENGVYRLEAQKDGFGNKITATTEDSVYPNVYRGEKLELAEESNNLNYNIPLEPIVEEKTNTHVLREYARKAAHKTVSLIGVVATIVSLIISPNQWITVLLVFHIVLYGLMRRLAHKKIKGTFGSVTDKKTGREIGKVVVRVFDAAYNKLVDTGVTDSKGRYAILVGPSTYYITAEKEGFNTYQSPTIDFSSGETNGVGGVISRSFSLEPTNFDEKSGKGV